MAKSYGEQFNEALACETKEQADKWLASEIERYRVEFGKTELEAKAIICVNLGYMAGYYSIATAKKINQLFGATHPVFGDHYYHETVLAEQAMDYGKEIAGKLGRGQ